MNKIKLLLFILALCFTWNSAYSQPRINVIYPKNGQIVTAADSTFIFGSVKPVDSKFSINSKEVKLYPNGAFLAMIPVHVGDFSFRCQAAHRLDTAMTNITVQIPGYVAPIPADTFMIDTSYVYPQTDWVLMPGDLLHVAIKGTPACKANFSIEGVADDLPMIEVSDRQTYYWGEAVFGKGAPAKRATAIGVYTGVYLINTWEWASGSRIHFRLQNEQGDTLSIFSKGKVKIDNGNIPVIAKLTNPITTATTGPKLGYLLFLPQDIKLWITGSYGNYRRIRLSETDEAWVRITDLEILPPGTPPATSVVSVVRTKALKDKTRITVFTQERVPYKIEQIVKPSALLVTLYGVISDTDWIRYNTNDPLIREIHWDQPAKDVYRLRIELNQEQQWGYEAYYVRNRFIIEIKRKLQIASWPYSPLKNIVFTLDPGHGPDLGAVGPTGLTEKEANLQVCKRLKRKLEKKGAFVFLTREGQHGIDLQTRPAVASFIGSNVLLSVHFNALPDGVDPYANHGTSTYYYHPMSYKLAHIIQQTMLKRLGLPDYGLFYGNLALTRPTDMLAVLIEPAFIMHPEEEMLIRSDAFQEKLADSLVEAFEKFFKEQK